MDKINKKKYLLLIFCNGVSLKTIIPVNYQLNVLKNFN